MASTDGQVGSDDVRVARAFAAEARIAQTSIAENKKVMEALAARAARIASPPGLTLTGVLTGSCIASSVAAAVVLTINTLSSPNAAVAPAQLSVVISFLGMGFACLGFGLFLVGAAGAFKATSDAKSKFGGVNVETAAPGLVVMICATIVIFLAVELVKPPTPPPSSASTAGESGGASGSAAGSASGSAVGSAADGAAGNRSGSAGSGSARVDDATEHR